MARPPEPQKRRELARQAVAVLAAEGLDISMRRLADALEMKRPTLLYHFPSKAHIAESALEDLLSEQALFVLQRMAEHAHPIDRLYAQMRAIHEFHRGREGRLIFLAQAIAAGGSSRMAEIIDVGNRVFAMHREAAAGLVRRGIAEGTVRECDVDALLATMRAMTDGLVVQRLMTGLDLEPVHEFLWEQVLRPLKIDRPEGATGGASSKETRR